MIYKGETLNGAGGACKAFKYHNNRRMFEIQDILHIVPVAGSLNIKLNQDFDWDGHECIRGKILDVVTRPSLDGEWAKRICRFYKCKVGGFDAWAMKFETEKYRLNFVELISHLTLRERLNLCGTNGAVELEIE